ncbi:unnamed protein product [Paramecium primaurelia]|uniref:Transmembrane protein n=1 Tax=Paramecium primaurelia TaxID=5886 RepID=A0A8S1P1Q6_PARPR|nr:unnamed protein product [Paramecium primaurelia]
MHKCSLNFEDKKLEDQFQNEKLQKIRKPVYYATFIFFVLNGMKAILEFVRGTSFSSEINVGFVIVQTIMAVMVFKNQNYIKQALVITNIMSGFLQMNFNEEATAKQEFYSFGNSYALFQAIGYFISDFRDGVIQAISHLTIKIIITSIHSKKVDPLCTSLAITSSFFIVLTIYVSDYNYRKQFLANISDDVWDKQLPFLVKKPYIKFTHKNTYFNITSCNLIERFAGYKNDYCFGCNAREFLSETKVNNISLLNKLLSDTITLNTDIEAHLKCFRFNIRVCMYGFEKMNRIVILEKVMTKEKGKQFSFEFRKDLVQTLKQGQQKFQFLLFYNWGIQSCLLINNKYIKQISLMDVISKLNKNYKRYLSPIRIISISKSKLQIRTYSNLIKIYLFQIYHILIITQPRSRDYIDAFVKESEEYIEFQLQLRDVREFCDHYSKNIFVHQIERVILWERVKDDLKIQFSKQISFK